MNTYLNFEELPNGNLKITLTKEGREELKELMGKSKDYMGIWLDLIEVYQCNGSYQIVHPEKIAALTDSPIIGLNVDYDDNGEIEPNDALKIWWYPEYQVVSEFEQLLKHRSIVFTKAD